MDRPGEDIDLSAGAKISPQVRCVQTAELRQHLLSCLFLRAWRDGSRNEPVNDAFVRQNQSEGPWGSGGEDRVDDRDVYFWPPSTL